MYIKKGLTKLQKNIHSANCKVDMFKNKWFPGESVSQVEYYGLVPAVTLKAVDFPHCISSLVFPTLSLEIFLAMPHTLISSLIIKNLYINYGLSRPTKLP